MYDIDIKNPIISKKEIVQYINTLKNYEGYVQFSHRPINKDNKDGKLIKVDKDIFYANKEIKIEDEKGFIYEAHFCNSKKSISIKQINDSWLISTTDISDISDEDKQTYISEVQGCPNVVMAQIWKKDEDKYCTDMEVKKLKKVVFAGFTDG